MVDYGDLLIFDYAPNLKIVGTHHALRASDKRILEDLITESDFTALEWDEFRSKNQEAFICTSKEKRGYCEEEKTFYASKLDVCLLNSLYDFCDLDVIKDAELYGRNLEENEFDFCEKICKEQGKMAYLVDIPELIFFERLVELPIDSKLIAIISLKLLKKSTFTINKIVEDDREEYMLKEIEKYECSIQNLKRKGILVVGYTHAENYLSKMKKQNT